MCVFTLKDRFLVVTNNNSTNMIDIQFLNYDHNLYMASPDVEFLFTNIHLEETIKNCVSDLFSNNFYSGKLSRKDLYELLKLATTESSFIFDNKIYKQIDSCNGFTLRSHTG